MSRSDGLFLGFLLIEGGAGAGEDSGVVCPFTRSGTNVRSKQIFDTLLVQEDRLAGISCVLALQWVLLACYQHHARTKQDAEFAFGCRSKC